MIGAGYLAGGYFFARVVVERKWHRVQAGFPAITVFTIFMLAATVLHWARFHHGSFSFYAWTVIYIVTPLLVPFIWWRNRTGVSRELEENDLRFSAAVRWLFGGGAGLGVLLGILLFIRPTLLYQAVPWKLQDKPITYVFIVALPLGLMMLVMLHFILDRSSRQNSRRATMPRM